MTWGMSSELSQLVNDASFPEFRSYNFSVSSSSPRQEIPITDNLSYVLLWKSSNTGSQALTCKASEVIDFRWGSLWGGGSGDCGAWDTTTLKAGTDTTFDTTTYLLSNETIWHRLRTASGEMFEFDVFMSGGGDRCTAIIKKMPVPTKLGS